MRLELLGACVVCGLAWVIVGCVYVWGCIPVGMFVLFCDAFGFLGLRMDWLVEFDLYLDVCCDWVGVVLVLCLWVF